MPYVLPLSPLLLRTLGIAMRRWLGLCVKKGVRVCSRKILGVGAPLTGLPTREAEHTYVSTN